MTAATLADRLAKSYLIAQTNRMGSPMTDAFLPDRAFLKIGGADAETFLQALITTDLEALGPKEARPGALLTPQGKILFDFMIWRDGDGFLIETAAGQRDALVKRLTMYKLRAAVEISVDARDGITLFWGEDSGKGEIGDARFLKAGAALTRAPGQHGHGVPAGYNALRIRHGIAEAGDDFALQDAFPHDVLLDLNGGLSFRKGCYVGQEVVSRMQHRGTARRRVAVVAGESALPPTGTVISAGGKPIGTLGSVSGTTGLAIIRTDRAGEAIATGVPILAGDVAVTVSLPAWSGLTFPTTADEAQA